MTAYSPKPVTKPKGQGGSASSAPTTADPIQPDYPHDTFTAPKSVLMTTSIVKPGDGVSAKGAKTVNPTPPRC